MNSIYLEPTKSCSLPGRCTVCVCMGVDVHAIMPLYVVDLIWCTNVGNVSISDLVKHLLERTQATSWVVVLKTLLTIHDVINFGNEVLGGLYNDY